MSMSDTTTDAGVTAGPYDHDDELEAADAAEGTLVGRLVKVTHFDTANMVDVVRFGTVVEHPAEGVVVGLFPNVIGPLPLDPDCHERVDAPRVEVVDLDEDTAHALVAALTGA